MASHLKMLAFEEVSKHDKINDCWLIFDGKVYDVTPFLYEHPGGVEALMSVTGKNATKDFEDVGHSDSAKELLEKYHIGNIDMSTVPKKRAYVAPQQATYSATTPEFVIKIIQFLTPLFILASALAFVVPHYTRVK